MVSKLLAAILLLNVVLSPSIHARPMPHPTNPPGIGMDNLAGIDMRPPERKRFVDVFGTITVPHIQVPPRSSVPHIQDHLASSVPQFASFWVGFDAGEDHPSPFLLRAGLQCVVDEHGAAKFYPFVQWHPQHPPYHYTEDQLQLVAGNKFSVAISVNSAGTLSGIRMENLSKSRLNPIVLSKQLDDPASRGSRVKWMVEEPDGISFPTSELVNSDVTFTDCKAWLRTANPEISDRGVAMFPNSRLSNIYWTRQLTVTPVEIVKSSGTAFSEFKVGYSEGGESHQ
ncbi:hypothetical protein EV360DRAFT_70124 [Lentinula raphanica]|nr:hypothetical protein EV360DRAFT_70124 [Lentinula raphanica]